MSGDGLTTAHLDYLQRTASEPGLRRDSQGVTGLLPGLLLRAHGKGLSGFAVA